jgi:molybdate transport system permease protein
MTPLLLSLLFACAGTLFTALAALPIAAWACGQPSGRRVAVESLLTLPLVVPPTAVGYLFLRLLGHDGPFGALHLLFTPAAAVLAATIAGFPLLFRAALAAFEQTPPLTAQAAAAAGLPPRAVWLRVRLPLAASGLAAGAALALARGIGEFGITMMIAGAIPGRTETASIAIYAANAAGRTADADQLVLAVLLTSGLLVLAVSLLRRGR